MTEQYERVEIKPGDNKTWQDMSIYVGADKLAYTILHVGEYFVFASRLDYRGYYFETLHALEAEFYIRKPKPKMVKMAKAVCWSKGLHGKFIHDTRFLTEQEAKNQYGEDLIKWPYGEIIEVPEGE